MTVEPRTHSSSAAATAAGHQPANLGDILERVLDRGIVIVGDIRVSLLDIELLTIKLRLLIASVDTARELGIDWWQHDPWLSSSARAAVDGADLDRPAIAAPDRARDRRLPAADRRTREPDPEAIEYRERR